MENQSPTKRIFRLELCRLLGEFLEGIGVAKPKLLGRNTYDVRNSVLLGFEGENMPYRVLSGGPMLPTTFYGDDPVNAEMAEHKAIMSLYDHLKQTYGVEIHDISHLKIKLCDSKATDMLSAIGDFVMRFSFFLNKYHSCQNEMEKIISTGSENSTDILADIITAVNDILSSSATRIANVKHRLVRVDFEGSSYRTGVPVVCQMSPVKAPSIVWKVSAKDALSDIMNSLGLLQPNYSNEISGGDLFIGYCKIQIGEFFGSKKTGRTKFKGSQKETPYEAECSAAEEAIRFLELNRDFEVVDFNYGTLVCKRKELCSIVEHRSELDALFSEANRSWATVIMNVEDFISAQYGLSQAVPLSGGDSGDWPTVLSFLRQLEKGVSAMKQVHYMAVSDMYKNAE